nr:hypothetical protein [Tanacetum cinerariifolium]
MIQLRLKQAIDQKKRLKPRSSPRGPDFWRSAMVVFLYGKRKVGEYKIPLHSVGKPQVASHVKERAWAFGSSPKDLNQSSTLVYWLDREYLASDLNGFDLQQYDGLASTSDRANKLLMLYGRVKERWGWWLLLNDSSAE